VARLRRCDVKLLKLVNPVAVTKEAFGLAGSAVGVAEVLAGRTTRIVLSSLHRWDSRGQQSLQNEHEDVEVTRPTDVAGEPVVRTEAEIPDVEGGAKGPSFVSVEPHAPEEPPIDVVGRALADEVSAALDGDPEPEEHLAQPVIDPSEAKAVITEMQMMSRAADPRKK
jgi:hypothetical protein